VRRAQRFANSSRHLEVLADVGRNHRERKENYTRSLEREVLRLREQEAAVLSESRAVHEENVMLREILMRHSIPIPDRLKGLNRFATVCIRDRGDGGQGLQVTMPEPVQSFPTTTIQAPPTTPFSESVAASSSPESEKTAVARSAGRSDNRSIRGLRVRPQPGNQRPSEIGLDSVQIGIDFVLSLEQPCLGHTRGDASGNNPSGHVLTAQAPLLIAAPETLAPSTTWEVPAVEIERLLQLSSQLNLFGEVTPVQAWARIRSYPGFERLTRDGLERLKLALLEEIQCHG